ncbi:MAG: AraC family transcriptional regulator [Sediminibacterium sp.]
MKQAIRKPILHQEDSFIVKQAFDQHFFPHWHFHPELELFFVAKGSGTRFVGDAIEPFFEEDLVFVGSNLPHLWRSDAEYFKKNSGLSTQSIVVYFSADFLGDVFFDKKELRHIKQLFALASQRGLKIRGRTHKSVSEKLQDIAAIDNGLQKLLLLLSILDEIAESKNCTPLASTGYLNTIRPDEADRMQQIHEYVLKNFQQKISIPDVAWLIGMSPTGFSRYFTATAHKTFSEFLIEIRIGHACKQLMNKEQSIAQIAYESGFETLSNFNDQFKRRTGMKPLEYHKAQLAKDDHLTKL